MQNEMQKPSDKLKAARHTFSLLGFSALLLLVGQLLVSVLVGICIGLFFPEGNTPAWLTMLLAYIGVYGVAFPLSALPLCRLPAAAPDKGKISVQHFLAFCRYSICAATSARCSAISSVRLRPMRLVCRSQTA